MDPLHDRTVKPPSATSPADPLHCASQEAGAPQRSASKQASGSAGAATPWNDPACEPLVRIQGAHKDFGDLTAVRDVSLEIFAGELFCLLGGSGCGKTTLLRMLAGFETPTRGSFVLDGEELFGQPPYARPVNMMFQSYALFPHMNVEQNVAFGLTQERLPRAEIRERVARMLEMVELTGVGRRRPHQLSGGQQQRVALARCLVKRPKLLLLDEPLGALDKKLRERTQIELVKLQQRLGVTAIVVTHDQEEAMTLATRIGVMHEGQIVQVDPPRTLYERPRSRLVAEFIGDVNLFEGRIAESTAEQACIECAVLQTPLRVDTGSKASVGARVWLALRPEKLRLTRHPPGASAPVLHGVVTDVSYLGGRSSYQVETTGGASLRATRVHGDVSEDERMSANDRVYLSWSPSSMVLLER